MATNNLIKGSSRATYQKNTTDNSSGAVTNTTTAPKGSSRNVYQNRLTTQYDNTVGKYSKPKTAEDVVADITDKPFSEEEKTEEKKSWLGRAIDSMKVKDGMSHEEFLANQEKANKDASGVWGGSAKGWAGNMLDITNTVSNVAEDAWGNPFANVDISEEKAKPTNPFSRPQMSHEEFMARQYKSNREDAQAKADELAEESATAIDKARKSGGENNKIMNVATDLVVNASQMALDAVSGSPSLAMFLRSAGSGAREAKEAGASNGKQLAYGITKGAIELATEKLTDGLAGIYGKGAADEVVEQIVSKLAKTDNGRTVIRAIAGAVGEGAEEVVSDLLDPFAKLIYDAETQNKMAQKFGSPNGMTHDEFVKAQKSGDNETTKLYNPADIGYDFLIGAAMGALGSGVGIINGADAQKNATLRTNEATAKTVQELKGLDRTNRVTTEDGYTAYLTQGQNNDTTVNILDPNGHMNEFTIVDGELNEVSNLYGDIANGINELRAETAVIANTATEGSQGALQSTNENAQITSQNATQTVKPNENKTNRIFYPKGTKISDTNIDSVVGLMVRPSDRENIGTIIGDNGDGTYEVHFIARDGSQATKKFSAEELSLYQNYQKKLPSRIQRASDVLKTAPNNPLSPTQSAPTTTATATTQTTQTAQPTQQYDFGDDMADTQSRFAKEVYTEEEYEETGGQTQHTVHHDADVDNIAAQKVATDLESARQEVLNADTYSDVNVATARMVIGEDVAEARSLPKEERGAVYEKLAKVRGAMESGLTKAAQTLRQAGRGFFNSSNEIISEAANILYGENANLRKGVGEAKKIEIMDLVTDLATRVDGLNPENTQDVIGMIHEVSEIRRTTGLLAESDSKMLDDILYKIAEGEDGNQFLKNLLTSQIRSVAKDYQKIGFINVLKGIKYLNALGNPKTTATNVGANTAFGSVMSVIENDLSIPFDMLISMYTGKREVAFDRGLFSSEAIKGMSGATLKSIAEVTLDAQADQSDSSSKYNEINNSTFKMVGNWFERFLSTVEKYQGYALKTTDQASKGAIEAETTRGLNELKGESNDNVTIAQDEAKYRTLQNIGKVAESTNQIKKILNKVHVGSEKTGTYGLGDHFLMFAQVPANQVATQLERQPVVSALVSVGNVCKLISEAKNGEVTAERQRNTARSIGKLVNGMAMVGASAVLASFGCVRCVDEDDDDLAKLLKAQGKTGTQFNVDATVRLIFGGDSMPQEGDTWLSMNWIPQLNSMMITGNAMYESFIDDGTLTFGEILRATGKGLVDSLKDFPAVSGITSTIKSAKYAKYTGDDRDELTEEEKEIKDAAAKWGAVAGNELGNLVTGVTVPNVLRAITTGTDDTERDLYASNNPLDRATDYFKSGVPGLRQTIAPKLDNFGNEIKNEGGIIQFANKVFLPGALSHDRSTAAQTFTTDMVELTGDKGVVPSGTAPSSIKVKVDDKNISVQLTADEKATWQKAYGSICESLYLGMQNSDSFNALQPTEKADALKAVQTMAKGVANAMFKEKRGYDGTNSTMELLLGVERKGKDDIPLSVNNIVDYTNNKIAFNNAVKNSDYEAIDRIVNSYGSWNDNLQKVFEDDVGSIKDYKRAADADINSETWDTYKKSVDAVQWEEDTESDGSRIKYKAIARADIPESEKDKILAMNDEISKNWKMADNVLSKFGYSKEQIYNFFDNADWTLSQKTDEYTANGQLGAYEAYIALKREPNLTEQQRKEIFTAFVEATGEPGRYDGWSRNTGKNEYEKYTYDYCKYVDDRYDIGASYGKQNKNALTSSRNTNTSSNSNNRNQLLEHYRKLGIKV